MSPVDSLSAAGWFCSVKPASTSTTAVSTSTTGVASTAGGFALRRDEVRDSSGAVFSTTGASGSADSINELASRTAVVGLVSARSAGLATIDDCRRTPVPTLAMPSVGRTAGVPAGSKTGRVGSGWNLGCGASASGGPSAAANSPAAAPWAAENSSMPQPLHKSSWWRTPSKPWQPAAIAISTNRGETRYRYAVFTARSLS